MARGIVVWLFFLVPGLGIAQDCDLTLSGRVWDKSTGIPLAYANIYVQETGQGAFTDTAGHFSIPEICARSYHVRFTHLGCQPEELFITISADTSIEVRLSHHAELLDEIKVHGERGAYTTQPNVSLDRERITAQGTKSLGEMLTQISGVRSLSTGSGISKPVIHGLHGNRITILNHGINQAGQQWGNDHAPEIDPFVADHLSVIKGSAALEYGGNALGGVVLVEPGDPGTHEHLHGEINYLFETNGRGHTLNAALGKMFGQSRIRGIFTGRILGDRHAPDYFLTNTGKREQGFALHLDRPIGVWDLEGYYNLFHSEPGILRGSHIGSLSDLEEAIGREEPFFTEDDFSYRIEAPRQDVWHHLLKTKVSRLIDEDRLLTITYGGQLNQRKEFDVRRSGRSDIPALSLDLYNHLLEGKYLWSGTSVGDLKFGVSLEMEDNTNDPETGILPLIPDYRLYNTGVFAILQAGTQKLKYDFGARYDFRYLEALTITRTQPPGIARLTHRFHNWAASGGLEWSLTNSTNVQLNTGVTRRSPEPNELYSAGLHQGVSGIEEGNPDLGPETSFKATTTMGINLQNRLFLDVTGYAQWIDDYIYLQPQDSFRLTIRGAFPVFAYEQTNARIWGLDAQVIYEPLERVKVTGQWSIVRGRDADASLPLVLMPPDHSSLSLRYTLPVVSFAEEFYFGISGKYTWQQTRLEESQDFLAPPDNYFLVGAGAGLTFSSGIEVSIRAENLLDTVYRDYLNRLRYFADEVGRNVVLGLKWVW